MNNILLNILIICLDMYLFVYYWEIQYVFKELDRVNFLQVGQILSILYVLLYFTLNISWFLCTRLIRCILYEIKEE